MISRLYSRFLDLKFSSKLIIANISLFICALVILSLIIYRSASNTLQEKILFSADQSYNQGYSFLSERLGKISDTITVVLQDNTLAEIVNIASQDTDIFTQMSQMNYISSFLGNLESNVVLDKITLYVRDGMIYSNPYENSQMHLATLGGIDDTIWYFRMQKNTQQILWCPSSYFTRPDGRTEDTISALAYLLSRSDYRKPVALLRVDIHQNALTEVLSNSNVLENSITYLQTADGYPVCSSRGSLDPIIPADRITAMADTAEWTLCTGEDGCSYLFRSSLLPGTDWYMITALPAHDIYLESKALLSHILLALFVICLIVCIFVYLLSTGMTNRISQLSHKMRNVQNGDFSLLEATQRKDEVGELVSSYNYMVSQLSRLMEQQFLLGQKVKSYELKVLQSQINPHFLYNTLEMIIYLAQEEKYQKIESCVKALSRFYRLSLSRGREIIPIRDELAHVNAYVNIQNLRFEDRIQLLIDMDDYLHDFDIPKITLQPIVENAILHGIQEKESKSGTIVISGCMEGEDILLTVEDDGVGMSPEKLAQISSGTIPVSTGSSYGICNIHERIRLAYGSEYGLTYRSDPGKGTTVEIRLPAKSSQSA